MPLTSRRGELEEDMRVELIVWLFTYITLSFATTMDVDSDSDISIFDDDNELSRAKGKGKGKATDKRKKDKGKRKPKDVVSLVIIAFGGLWYSHAVASIYLGSKLHSFMGNSAGR